MVVNAVYLYRERSSCRLRCKCRRSVVGRTTCLLSLDNVCLSASGGPMEEIESPFSRRTTVVGRGIGDPTTILARGCTFQAASMNDSKARC
jgi:hypothetical protein